MFQFLCMSEACIYVVHACLRKEKLTQQHVDEVKSMRIKSRRLVDQFIHRDKKYRRHFANEHNFQKNFKSAVEALSEDCEFDVSSMLECKV